MYPCNQPSPHAPALYTYYAIVSLVVIILAISLIWIPLVQLIAELNNIIAKVIIYISKELLGKNNAYFFSKLEAFFGSQHVLIVISLCCVTYMLYLASGDFLIFAGCVVCNMPNYKCLQNIKLFTLGVIKYLLNLTGRRRPVVIYGNNTAEHYDPQGKADIPVEDEVSFSKNGAM